MVERRRKERETRRLDEEAAAAAWPRCGHSNRCRLPRNSMTSLPPRRRRRRRVPGLSQRTRTTRHRRPTRIEELLGKFASELVCDECRHQSVTHELFVCVIPLRSLKGNLHREESAPARAR